MTAKKPDQMPAEGGSYIRDAKGNLLKVGLDKAKQEKPKPKTSGAKNTAPNSPVKEA